MRKTKEIKNEIIRVYKFNFLESILKAIRQMIEKHENCRILLKTYLKAGVTPDCTENPKDAKALKSQSVFYF